MLEDALERTGSINVEALSDDATTHTPEDTVSGGNSPLLRRIQQDIHQFSSPGLSGSPAPADPSLQIHNCHSPAREVEVIHDVLLDALDTDTALGPEDILVMTPDLDTYVPFIGSVFNPDGAAPSDVNHQLPFNIVDRNPRGEMPYLDALFRVLDTAGTRLTAPKLLDLMSMDRSETNLV